MRKLKITEDMAEDRKLEATHITFRPRSGKLRTVMMMMMSAVGGSVDKKVKEH